MNIIRQVHRQAMELSDQALIAKMRGNIEDFDKYSLQALELETQAAEMVFNDLMAEPTRSVLYRSAASIAIDCKKYREAERLITTALSGNPPEEIAEELRDLLEQVYLQRHLLKAV